MTNLQENTVSDKITPTLTLSALNKLDAAATPTPFTFGGRGKIVEFPDPMGMSPEDSERFLSSMEEARSPVQIVREWLSPEDADLLLEALTMRQLVALIRAATTHYQASMGAPGEDGASTTE